MIDKLAGLPTQIRQLEKRLKDMDASKVKPALVKEITDTIKNLKDMLKEKQDKREQRKKDKEEKAQEVEAAPVGMAPALGATAPNAITTTQPGQPEATPTTPDNAKVSCALCGGIEFGDQAAYQQHMEFTHASNVAPTTPGQKLDKTVAAVDPLVNKVETDPKIAPGIIVPDSVKKHDEVVERVENDPKIAPHIISEQGPQFKLDDVVMPIRGSESKGKVMRWDGKPNDLVYVMWESGPLKDRDTFGGYYPHDLKADAPPAPVEAAMPAPEPVCEKCVAMQQKHGDLKDNYEAFLKDMQEEREIHYAQGNHSWVARLDQKIEDFKKAFEEKYPKDFNGANEKQAAGGPRLIRQIHRATSGHGYEATEYDLANGQFKQNVPLKINETKVRMTDPTSTQFEVKYDGMDWRMVAPQEFEQWLEQWKETNHANTKNAATDYPTDPKWGPDHDVSPWTCSCGATLKSKNEGLAHFRAHHGKGKTAGAQNAEELTIMDHTPPRANSGPDAGGKDPADEFQDEWAMPLTSATKINVFKRELLATPAEKGYDISHEGKKLFNITGKENKPMNKKQLEFCAQIELTRGMKQAKLVEKIANLEAGSTVFIMAHDKTTRRVKFASLEHGFRGWASASKFAYLVKEGQMMQHKDHIDNTFGNNGKQVLVDCPNGSGNMVWLQMGELLPINPPPATPESLNDLESAKTVKCICGDRQDQHSNGGACTACKCPKWSLDKEPATRTVKEMPADKVTRDSAQGCKHCDHRASSHTDGKGNSAGCSICDCTSYAKSNDKKAFNEYTDCKKCGHMKGEHGNDKVCLKCGKTCEYIPKHANIDFPLTHFTRPEAKQRADQFGLIDVEDSDLTPAGLAAKKQEMLEGHDIEAKKKKKKCNNCGYFFPLGFGGGHHTPCPPSNGGGDAGGMGGGDMGGGVAAVAAPKGPEFKLTPDMICTQCEQDLAIPGKGMCKDCYKHFLDAHPELRNAAQKTASSDPLVDEFYAKHPSYNGWTFDYEYPGYYAFYSPDQSKVVYFTPDFNEKGIVDIQITNSDGENLVVEDVPYKAPLNADALFAIVKPYLDQSGSEKESLQTQLPKAILPQRGDVNTHAPTVDPVNGPTDEEVQQKAYEMYKAHWDALGSKEQDEVYKALGVTSSLKVKADNKIMVRCEDCKKKFHTAPDSGIYKCPDCNKTASLKVKADRPSFFQSLTPESQQDIVDNVKAHLSAKGITVDLDKAVNEWIVAHDDVNSLAGIMRGEWAEVESPNFRRASVDKSAKVVEHEDGWHVLSEKGKNLGGPYKSKAQAVKRLRQVEYFKHHASKRPFSKQASSEQYTVDQQTFPNHYTVHLWVLKDSFGPDNEAGMSAIYDLESTEQDYEESIFSNDMQELRIEGPHVSAQRMRGAEDLGSEASEYLLEQIEPRWERFKAKIGGMPDPLKPEMREQFLGEQAVVDENLLKQELEQAKGRVKQLQRELQSSLDFRMYKKADAVDPYVSLTDHITDMRSRITQVQDKIQTVPAIKTAEAENGQSTMSLEELFADLTQGINLLEQKVESGDTHAQIEELENKLWKLEEACGITPKLSAEEKAEPEHKEIVEDIEKKASNESWDKLIQLSENDDFLDEVIDAIAEVLNGGFWQLVNNKGENSGVYLNSAIAALRAAGCKEAAQVFLKAYQIAAQHEFMTYQRDQNGEMQDTGLEGAFDKLDDAFYAVSDTATDQLANFYSSHKQADQVTDQTIVTNDPNAIIDPTNPLSPEQAAALPTIKNVQPTDDDNLAVPVVAPTSPLPPGQKWVFDTQFNKYVAMPDPAAAGKTV